ncbi:transposase, partial [Leptolyngbya sp. BC1307]|uniref:ISAzo13-like element transposase-related protein n=1 Tax=Leptolyngbya sp. BC1307 TaxID=2029589 RepID=UPI00148205E4
QRTQFIKRMAQFAQREQMKIHLVYYPPYHSKYNPIERCWAALENYWNGAILDTVETALRWAANMTWNGFEPMVELVEATYQKGIKVTKDELEPFEQQWQRSETLPKWDVTIVPI